jgi:hypothetical protein
MVSEALSNPPKVDLRGLLIKSHGKLTMKQQVWAVAIIK